MFVIQPEYFHLMFQFPRTNTQYHKIFKDISENELLKQSKQMLLTLLAYSRQLNALNAMHLNGYKVRFPFPFCKSLF